MTAAEFDIIAHLDAMEGRIRLDIQEVRTDVKKVSEVAANHEPRLEAVEKQTKWIWGSAGSGFLTMIAVFAKHVLLGGSSGR